MKFQILTFLTVLLFITSCSTTDSEIEEYKLIKIRGQVFGSLGQLPKTIFLTIEDNTFDNILLRGYVNNYFEYNFNLNHTYTIYTSLSEDNFTSGIKQISNWKLYNIYKEKEITILMYENE